MIDHQAIESLSEMAPLPDSVIRLMSLAASEDPDLVQIAEVIRYDPVLAGQVIKIANSVAYGALVEIADVMGAVSRVGATAMLSLAMGVSVRGVISKGIPEYNMEEGDLWRLSCAASLAAEELGRHCDAELPGEVATAALLHDIGKLVMARVLDENTVALLRASRELGHLSEREAEMEILGVHHAELSGLVVQKWKLPESIRLGVSYHHDPGPGGAIICDAVHVAQAVAEAVYNSVDAEEWTPVVNEEACGRLGFDRSEKLSKLCQLVAERLDDVCSGFASVEASKA